MADLQQQGFPEGGWLEHAHMKVCAWACKWKRRALPYKQGCYSHVKMLLISWYFQGRQCCIPLACFSKGKRPKWLFVQALGFFLSMLTHAVYSVWILRCCPEDLLKAGCSAEAGRMQRNNAHSSEQRNLQSRRWGGEQREILIRHNECCARSLAERLCRRT